MVLVFIKNSIYNNVVMVVFCCKSSPMYGILCFNNIVWVNIFYPLPLVLIGIFCGFKDLFSYK